MMRRFSLLALLALLILVFSAVLPAQKPPAGDDKSTDRSQIVRKNFAPVSKDVLKVKLPRATEATLSNGLVVLIIEDHRLPLVSMQLNIGAAGPLLECSKRT